MAYEGNRYAGLNRKGPDDKAGWLGTAGTVAGAGLGLLAGPGGMAAGAKLGGALGGVTHDAVNGTLTPMSVAGDVMQGVSGFNGLNGAMDNKSILEAFMRDPHQFRVGFANGGLVTGPTMDMASQWAQMDPVQRAMLQAQQAVGPAPAAPTPQPLQQAQHPTLEALASLMPDLLGSLPKPANPKNTKAIGAWAPFAGQALAAPATIAQARRKGANAPIEQANTTARSDYEAKRKAYEDRKTMISDTLVGNATKPFAERAADATISLDMAKQLGHPEWAGLTESQARLKMQGMPDQPKPPTTTDPVKFRQYARGRMNMDQNIKPFVKVRDSFNIIDRVARNGTAASDLSLIFAFMRILDPDSIVRESEQATAANARGVPEAIRAQYNAVVNGAKLGPAQREDFRQQAVNLMLSRTAALREALDSYALEAEMAGVDIGPIISQFSRYAKPEYEEEVRRSMGAGTPSAAPVGPTPAAAGRRTK